MYASTQCPIITHIHSNTRISINRNEHKTLFSFVPSFLFEHWSISWYILFYVNGLIYYHIFWWFWLPFFKHKPLMYILYIYIPQAFYQNIIYYHKLNHYMYYNVRLICFEKELSSRYTSSKCNNRNDYNHNVKKMYIPSLRVTCRWKIMVMEIGDDATHCLRWIS